MEFAVPYGKLLIGYSAILSVTLTLTDAIALRRDGNYSSFPAEVPFNFLVINNVRLILSAAFTGPLEKVFS
jgi:hypothetical protein